MIKEVMLSDGQPASIRVLGLFELDAVGPGLPGPYRYSILTYSGQVYEAEYRLPESPPEKPKDEQPAPNSQAWRQLQDYETYLCALAHEETRMQAVEAWLNNCAAYILTECLDEETRRRLVEPEDYQTVYTAATVPRLRMEDIAQVLRQTFRAEFAGLEVLDALHGVEAGGARLDPVAMWESELLNALGLVTPEQEAEYAHLPVMTRARKVAAFKLADWLATLEADQVHREFQRKQHAT